MKKIVMIALALAVPGIALAGPRAVKGYVKSDGTYVAPHYSTTPNSTKLDNYSSRGNFNPYTGQTGTVNPYAAPTYSPYNAPRKKSY